MSAKRRRTALQIVESLEPEDRLSNLPHDLICHILSLLPTLDAVRTSLLSKQWRRMWYSSPSFDFDEECSLRKFCTFVNYCMKRRKTDIISVENTAITRFRLAIRPTWKIIDQWLKIVGKSKSIQELDLDFYAPAGSGKTYSLSANSIPARSVKRLSLTNTDITGLNSTVIPLLESLSLVSVKLNDKLLHGLLSSSSRLEKLLLSRCTGLSDLRFTSLSLKFLEIDSTPARTVFVKSAYLESLVISGSQVGTSWILLPPLGKLENLSFSDVVLRDQHLTAMVSRLPRLESLTLRCCRLNRFEIYSRVLKRLSFAVDESRCDQLEVKIITPNLVHFSFIGSPTVDLTLLAQKLSEANVKFHKTEYDTKWFAWLMHFLRKLDFSTNVNLHVHSEEALIVPNEVRLNCANPFCNVEELKVVVKEPSVRRSDLMDSMSWMTTVKS